MLEIEIKARCEDLGAMRSLLIEQGASPQGCLIQKDSYLTHPCRDFGVTDEALRIRDDGKSRTLHYKGPRLGGKAKSREEIAVPLVDDTAMVAVLERLGFRTEYMVRKQRETFILHDCEVSLDSVDGLGSFIEVEYIGAEDIGEKVVSDVASLLGIEGCEKRSYLELLYFAEEHV